MHVNLLFSTPQVLWTLTFAGLLVLLVVLLGRDRARRFPCFTASIVLMALRLLTSRLLFDRLSPLVSSEVFLTLSDLAALVNLLVVLEMARHAFGKVRRQTWALGSLALLAAGGAVVVEWGPWPAWKTFTGGGTLAALRMMQLAAQKADLLADVLVILLGVLVVFFGRRFQAGWRSHTQRIVVGLSTGSLAQLGVRATWQIIAHTAMPHSQAEYEQVMNLQSKIYNANNLIYILVLVWWIACLWIDEPGAAPAPAAETASEQPPAE